MGDGRRDDLPVALAPIDRAARVSTLRRLLRGSAPVLAPGAADALGARLVERAGFDVCYATGAGAANAAWGLPDVGLPTLTEVAAHVARLAAVVRIPLVADADDGYGGPLSVMRTVRALEAAGAAAIQLEDQAAPKRCGHFEGKRLVTTEEMVAKILAACRVRTGGTVIVARTDALAVEGFSAAVERARRYRQAGADVLFVEAPQSTEQLRRLAELFPGVPLVANIVQGGKTPELSLSELGRLGYRLVVHANLLMRVMVRAGQEALEHLRLTGTGEGLEARMLGWADRQELVDLAGFDATEDALRRQARDLLAAAPEGVLTPAGDPK